MCGLYLAVALYEKCESLNTIIKQFLKNSFHKKGILGNKMEDKSQKGFSPAPGLRLSLVGRGGHWGDTEMWTASFQSCASVNEQEKRDWVELERGDWKREASTRTQSSQAADEKEGQGRSALL